MISTAKDYFDSDNGLYARHSVIDKDGNFVPVCSYEKAIEFTKLHRKAILEAASEESNFDISDLDKAAEALIQLPNSILKCYPEENIR